MASFGELGYVGDAHYPIAYVNGRSSDLLRFWESDEIRASLDLYPDTRTDTPYAASMKPCLMGSTSNARQPSLIATGGTPRTSIVQWAPTTPLRRGARRYMQQSATIKAGFIPRAVLVTVTGQVSRPPLGGNQWPLTRPRRLQDHLAVIAVPQGGHGLFRVGLLAVSAADSKNREDVPRSDLGLSPAARPGRSGRRGWTDGSVSRAVWSRTRSGVGVVSRMVP